MIECLCTETFVWAICIVFGIAGIGFFFMLIYDIIKKKETIKGE